MSVRARDVPNTQTTRVSQGGHPGGNDGGCIIEISGGSRLKFCIM